MLRLTINGDTHELDVDGDTPLLWVLRDHLSLTGTKFSCGIGVCGSCTVLIDGKPSRSCVLAANQAAGKKIVTIEGISTTDSHPVQVAWEEHQVPQCGYCQSGQILSAIALLNSNPAPTDEDINNALSGILCRCGTYPRVRSAIMSAAAYMLEEGSES
ncbi:MAG: (2Fe-2S)-binding protein [Candidatus Thiodiazotropha sp. (ex Epidulcina cf. delphinae)]|nr:(2Fe-2S)-binding protein [Candidatus Thiodiazotropha sp. (ex Epidulcina cf. delphinae)]